MNGLALSSGIIPFGDYFLVFSDYMRPSLRMAALMKIQSIFVYTHDSIGLGEDGPTHQPIEHINALSLIPNLVNFRPMDANETVIAWKTAIERKDGPTTIILTRQGLPVYKRGKDGFANVTNASKGAYVLTEDENYEVILVASGSEVEIAVDTKVKLNKKGIGVRVVSMPSKELFNMQSERYKNTVLPDDNVLKVGIEAGSTSLWCNYLGNNKLVFGIDHFGASAPYEILYEKYGLTADNIAGKVLKKLKSGK
ncbi:MAG: transketolase C-terminal domain-containing protein [Saprospiraceae bacterium]